jgi:tellurite resistance protein TerC
LRGAVDKFKYLPQGIAVVLIFIGVKMLIEMFKINIPIYVSLLVIIFCIGSAMLYSFLKQKK